MQLDMNYWNRLKAPAVEGDVPSINDAFHSGSFTDEQKLDLARLLLAGRLRIMDEERSGQLNDAIAIFNHDFAVEELFFTEYTQLFNVWRYDYKKFIEAIPYTWAKKAIRAIYVQLGVELDDDEVSKIYHSDCIYSAFFDLIKDTLKDSRYFIPSEKDKWNQFAFTAYFNMYAMFGKLGFNGYSPYIICADIGLLTPPASQWRTAALTEEDYYLINELKTRGRGRAYPTWAQNRFLGRLAKI